MENKNYVIKYPITTIIVIYLLSNIFLLTNDGFFWDDWCMTSDSALSSILAGVGSSYLYPIHHFLLNIFGNSTFIYHLILGLIEIFGFIFFYFCLKQLKVNNTLAFFMTLLYSILPYNQAKVSIACFSYSVGVLFFIIALFLFIKLLNYNNLFFRILSLILFFAAYTLLPSLLVFSLTLFLYLLFIRFNFKIDKKSIYIFFKIVVKWIDFFILPFVFWIFRLIYLMPKGVYSNTGYRQVHLSNLFLSPVRLFVVFSRNIMALPMITEPYFFPLIILLTLFFYILFRKCSILNLEKFRRYFLFLGIFLFVGASISYVLVGLEPSFNNFNSRHQILLKIPALIFILFCISFIKSNKYKIIFISFILSISIVNTVDTQFKFQTSWLKQLSLQNYFKKNKSLLAGNNILIIDNTKYYNEFNQQFAVYTYSGMFKRVYDTENTIAVNIEDKPFNINSLDSLSKNFYHINDVKNLNEFNKILTIDKNNKIYSYLDLMKLTYYYYTNKIVFYKNIENMLNYDLINITIKNY